MPRRIIAAGRSCLECRRRKIKCDRTFPCSYCVKTQISCVYPPPRPTSDANGDVLSRVERIEQKLLSFEQQFSEIKQLLLQRSSPSVTLQEHEHLEQHWDTNEDVERLGDGSEGLEKEEDHVVPSRVGEDVAQVPIEKVAEDQPPPNNLIASKVRFPLRPGHQLFLPFSAHKALSLESLHPPPTTIPSIWQKYIEAVDPVLKIFHTPTIQKEVIKVSRGRDNLDPSTECLMFAIYYSTVVSMSAAECHEQLEEDRKSLLNRYRTGIEYCLSRANLVKSLDMRVLQAFAIYLIAGRRDEEGPDVYTLMGLAIGVAFKIGLHRDGAALGLSPFEVEMRRRLWWQICILDVRVAEDHGSDPCILESAFNTRLPSNVDDACLDPDMREPPANNPGKTEMLFSLVRFESSYFARQLVFSEKFSLENKYMTLTTSQKCIAIDLFKARIEKQYLAYCDKEIPFDMITAATTRLILANLKLIIRKLRADQHEGSLMGANWRKICIQILQHACTVRNYEKGKQWVWLFQTYVEWDALASLLIHLCAEPSGDEVDSAWKVVDGIYYHWKQNGNTQLDRRWERIEELRDQALIARNTMRSNSRQARIAYSETHRHQSIPSKRAADDEISLSSDHRIRRSRELDDRQMDRSESLPTSEDMTNYHEIGHSEPRFTPCKPPSHSGSPERNAETLGTGTAYDWITALFRERSTPFDVSGYEDIILNGYIDQ